MNPHCWLYPADVANQEMSFSIEFTNGLLRELNPGPLAPEARIMPLDQAANAKNSNMLNNTFHHEPATAVAVHASNAWFECGPNESRALGAGYFLNICHLPRQHCLDFSSLPALQSLFSQFDNNAMSICYAMSNWKAASTVNLQNPTEPQWLTHWLKMCNRKACIQVCIRKTIRQHPILKETYINPTINRL